MSTVFSHLCTIQKKHVFTNAKRINMNDRTMLSNSLDFIIHLHFSISFIPESPCNFYTHVSQQVTSFTISEHVCQWLLQKRKVWIQQILVLYQWQPLGSFFWFLAYSGSCMRPAAKKRQKNTLNTRGCSFWVPLSTRGTRNGNGFRSLSRGKGGQISSW